MAYRKRRGRFSGRSRPIRRGRRTMRRRTRRNSLSRAPRPGKIGYRL